MALDPAGRAVQSLARATKGAALSPIKGQTPFKHVRLTNLITDAVHTVQFNPQNVSETINVNYTARDIRGLAHQPLDYENTENLMIETEFYADDFMTNSVLPLGSIFKRPKLAEFRKFLQALCYPARGARGSGLADAAPPRFLFNWPNTLFFVGVMRALKIELIRFNLFDAEVSTFVARVTIEETRSDRWTMEDALDFGNVNRVAPARRRGGQGAQFLLGGF